MKITDLYESLEEWNTGRWVHYSDHPMMKISPMKGHQDPSGIYFFPATFSPNSYWKGKKYSYFVKIKPDANILDLSKATEKTIRELVQMVDADEEFEAYIKQYPPEDTKKMLRMAWEMMRQKMMMYPAKWNNLLRQAGYDALFDDTGAIHSSEVQLLVLNPRILISDGMQTRKYGGFDAVMKVFSELKEICQQYGPLEIETPKRVKDRYSDKSTLEGTIRIERDKNNYAQFKVTYDPSASRKNVEVFLRWSMPNLGYGVGATYEIANGKYQFGDLTKLHKDLEKIFVKELAESETLNELTYPKSKIENSNIKSYKKILKDMGFTSLGSGTFATVFAHPNLDYVLKIFQARDTCYRKFYELASQHQENPHFPKFRGKLMRITDKVYAVRMEKLSLTTTSNLNADDIRWEIRNSVGGDPLSLEIKEQYPELIKACRLISANMGSCGNDIYDNNMMWRGNDPVIIDPYYTVVRT